MRQPVVRQLGVSGDGPEEPGREWGVDAVEELEKDQTEAIALRQEPVASRAREFLDQALPAVFGWLVTQRREAVVLGGTAQGRGGVRVQFRGRERVPCGDVGEAH